VQSEQQQVSNRPYARLKFANCRILGNDLKKACECFDSVLFFPEPHFSAPKNSEEAIEKKLKEF
jgi:hypothetical protein